MSTNRKMLLCRYRYDPLDRLTDCIPSDQADTHRFYLKNRLATEIQGSTQRSIFQQADLLLAQQQRLDGVVETTLLATDQQRSVLQAWDTMQPHSLIYTPYGHRARDSSSISLLGFNGERPDPVTGHYLLGNGYRTFNSVLMRFNSPDAWSPFGGGGLNAYAYCLGDPVNQDDSTGHMARNLWKSFLNLFRPKPPTPTAHTDVAVKSIKNVKRIADNSIIFDDYQDGLRLNIIGHSPPPRWESDPRYILIGNELFSPAELYKHLIRHVDLKKYASLRLLSCYSAATVRPFGAELATLTNKPVKAYSGPIMASFFPDQGRD
ncbi:RHS repeat-associated core domain-containing protein [Pseudomonas sp. NFACC05-1]|uniref:RHS repeat-associated core domain-containing protein n=1 Tax=Pseudomonas sp. NFACC05-1 TaxID=1566241 RepID=UPI0008714AB5|nr:RHS repeat-associated core domain-containing protein [Pseudomonas sp. NFACC05-1]SCW48726.1 RHS repeat-associated core domain-containing protein [Pseudomonas sp. NFACC05-1]